MIVGVLGETCPGERRVALTPGVLPTLTKKDIEVLVEAGAGTEAGFPDSAFVERGARILPERCQVLSAADVVLQVRAAAANPQGGTADLPLFRRGQVVIALMEPYASADALRAFASAGVTSFALELIPRITRAQSMDVLSSQATIAGYKAVLLAAVSLPRMFPMLMTAAGTVTAARVFVIGAGVAGLQAIATAHRLGAVVQAYDVRPAVKDQVQSVGAKFVELPLAADRSEDKGGYAKAMDEEFYRRQREMMTQVVAQSDVVITTAAVPGKKAPVLITREMVQGMAPGSVIIDLAAERGGNCELTRGGEVVVQQGVSIHGPLNLPATVPFHASQMYAKNISTFLLHLVRDQKVVADDESDEIIRETVVTRGGAVVNAKLREALKI